MNDQTFGVYTEAARAMQENIDLQESLTVSKQKLVQLYKTMGRVSKTKHVIQAIERKNSYITKWKSEISKWISPPRLAKDSKLA